MCTDDRGLLGVVRDREVWVAELHGTFAGTLVLGSHLDAVLRENFAACPAFHRLGIGELRLDLADELARVASVPALHQGRRDRERRGLPRAQLPGDSQSIQRRSPAPCPQKCCHHLLRLVWTEPPSDSQLVAILRPVPEPNSGQLWRSGRDRRRANLVSGAVKQVRRYSGRLDQE